jgi:hypothetical protein
MPATTNDDYPVAVSLWALGAVRKAMMMTPHEHTAPLAEGLVGAIPNSPDDPGQNRARDAFGVMLLAISMLAASADDEWDRTGCFQCWAVTHLDEAMFRIATGPVA